MDINISSAVCSIIPNFKVGVIEYKNLKVDQSPQMLKGRLQLFQESIFFDLENKSITELEGIYEWRQTFKLIGKDPNRYRHSAEALYRRIQKQKYLTTINSAIDLNNFYSLQYQLPIGIYNTDKLFGPITIRLGKEEEEYTGLNGRSNSLHKLLISSDDQGAFGSPFVDSDRAPVTEETNSALQLIYLRPSTDMENSLMLTESLMNMFVQVTGCDSSYKIIGCQ